MKGLEICKAYYEAYGKPMLEASFPHLLPHLAVGLVGSGSECFGYDDELSRDHDFEPCFCMFLPDEDVIDRHEAFALERAYAKLPKEYMGLTRAPLSPVGGNRHGVLRLSDFLADKTGTPDGRLTVQDWFSVPETALAEAVNGEVFWDGDGRFTAVRTSLACLPEDVRLKKLAGNLLLMGQAGQYNYTRCVRRGEGAAAQLAVFEFVRHAMNAVFLLNRTYLLYYKWCFRRLRELPLLSSLASPMERLMTTPNHPLAADEKAALMEQVFGEIVAEVKRQGLSDYAGEEAEGHAYAVNGKIRDIAVRNRHILYGV